MRGGPNGHSSVILQMQNMVNIQKQHIVHISEIYDSSLYLIKSQPINHIQMFYIDKYYSFMTTFKQNTHEIENWNDGELHDIITMTG